MPQISAFRGVRYNLGRVGSLSEVVAPPYDVISPEMQRSLYERHSANVVRLILNAAQSDDGELERYARAAQTFKAWQADGILQTEGDPALYVYHQHYTWGGQTHSRHAFICRVRLERFGEGQIFPHEETHPKAKADRLELMKACRANLSPVFGLYPDEHTHAAAALDEAVAGVAGLVCEDDLGVRHTLWPVTNVNTIGEVTTAMAEQPLFIADGHHRYETACNYRDHLEATQGPLPPNHPAHYVMVACVSMQDPGLLVLPTHRLFRGVPDLTTEELENRLGDHFLCEPLPPGIAAAEAAWQRMEADGDQELLALYVKRSDQWVLCQASEVALQRMEVLEPERSLAWQSLGVSLLHRLVIADLLESPEAPKPTYVHEVQEVIDGMRGVGSRSEEESGEAYNLAALVQPASLDHIQTISRGGERMPAKSTYFYPKLLSGLVFNPLH